jgi:hypothetical protein
LAAPILVATAAAAAALAVSCGTMGSRGRVYLSRRLPLLPTYQLFVGHWVALGTVISVTANVQVCGCVLAVAVYRALPRGLVAVVCHAVRCGAWGGSGACVCGVWCVVCCVR